MLVKAKPISYTMISSYNKCPWMFKAIYIDNLDRYEVKTDALVIGQIVHTIIEEFINNWKVKPTASPQKLLDEAIQKYLPTLKDGLKDEVIGILNNLDLGIIEMLRGKDVESEKAVALDINLNPVDFFSPDAVWRGKFDFVWIDEFLGARVVNILDFKTNREATADPLQLQFYAFLAHHYYKLEPVDMVNLYFWYLRQEGQKAIIHTTAKYSEHVDEFIAMPAKLFEQSEYPATPGEHCRYCSVAHHCPLVKDLAKSPEQVQSKSIEELVDAYLPLKQALNIIETKINEAFNEQKEEIEGAFVKVRRKEYNKTVLDEQGLREYLKSANIPADVLWDSVPITQTLFKKLGLKIPEEYVTKEVAYRIEVVNKEA